MYVNFNPVHFNEESSFRDLDRMLHFFEDGRHNWLIESDEDVDIIMNSNWVGEQTKRSYNIITKFLERSFIDLVHTPKNKRENRNILKVGGSLKDIKIGYLKLNAPLYILVENNISDKSFLNAIVRCFKKAGKKIKNGIDYGWIEFSNAGGKEMITKILYHNPSIKPIPKRYFVLIDSDKRNPTMPYTISIQKVETSCKTHKIPYHILEKREIENYIPNEVLSELPENLKDTTVAYLSLNSTQQDYYDMKDGFYKNKKNVKDPIFDGIPKEQFDNLKIGFKFKGYNPNDLHLLFDSENVNQKDLLKKCENQENPDELKFLLEKITTLL